MRRLTLRTGLAAAAVAAMLGCQNAPPTSPTPTAPSVNFVSVIGHAPSIGGTEQFKAIAALTDGNTTDITALAQWNTSNPAVLTVGSGGLVTGVAAGNAEIRATYQTRTGSTPVPVASVACVFSVQPAQLSISGTVDLPSSTSS